MLFDTSIKDKETKRLINEAVGKPYNVVDMFFKGVGQIGSSRMEVIEHSKLFDRVMRQRKQAVFANIALRPKGIIVVFFIRTSNYSWVIPFQYLSIFKTDILVIHGQGEFLKLKITGDQNRKILDKILELKNQYASGNYYGNYDH
tara:strand:- start:33874 stop:34308 length:435 start_codon:yes stop_codon:yes gene_type:complete